MLDQLPILADVQRYMDELAIAEVPEPSSSMDNVFLFQQVAVTREKVIKGRDWQQIADSLLSLLSEINDKNDPDLKTLAYLYTQDIDEF